ncbi:MAG TPA: hypothetical protein VFH49_00695, partial [Aquabacterium sp.]|nr:hypothetical protein [Aquabacterium sp.]
VIGQGAHALAATGGQDEGGELGRHRAIIGGMSHAHRRVDVISLSDACVLSIEAGEREVENTSSGT